MLSTLDKMWKINTAFVAKVIGLVPVTIHRFIKIHSISNTSQTDGQKKKMWHHHHHHHQEKRSKSLRQWGSHSGLIQIPSWDEHFGESGDSDTNKHPTPSFRSLTFYTYGLQDPAGKPSQPDFISSPSSVRPTRFRREKSHAIIRCRLREWQWRTFMDARKYFLLLIKHRCFWRAFVPFVPLDEDRLRDITLLMSNQSKTRF